jgi:tRNA(fMet)-specific endonuclease VapC
MTEYLLDTNHISPLITLEHPLREHVLSRFQHGDSFSIAAPALVEFLFGISTLPRAKQNRAEWERLHHRFIYYSIDKSDAEQAAELRLILRQQGRQLAPFDALIAVVALRYELVLLTTDKDFQPIVGLKQENWRDQRKKS